MFVCLQVPLEEGLNKTIQYFSRELEHQANNQYIPKPKAARMKKGRPRHNWGSCSLTTDSSETRSKAPSEALEASTYSEWSTLGTLYGEKDNYNKHNKRIVALLVFWMDGSWGKTPDWLFCFLLLKSQPWWRVAALIVLSMFVVYFSYFIGWLGGEVCVGVSLQRWGTCLSTWFCPPSVVCHIPVSSSHRGTAGPAQSCSDPGSISACESGHCCLLLCEMSRCALSISDVILIKYFVDYIFVGFVRGIERQEISSKLLFINCNLRRWKPSDFQHYIKKTPQTVAVKETANSKLRSVEWSNKSVKA